MMTAIEEQYKQLKASIKHNTKKLLEYERRLEKDKAELKRLERKVCVCPACNHIQEIPKTKATEIICRYCGLTFFKMALD